MLCAHAPGFHLKDLRMSIQPSQAQEGLTRPLAGTQVDWRAGLAEAQGEILTGSMLAACVSKVERRGGGCKGKKGT